MEMRALKNAVQNAIPDAGDTFVRESLLAELQGINSVLVRQDSRIQGIEDTLGTSIDLSDMADWPIKTLEEMAILINKVTTDRSFKSAMVTTLP